MKKEFLYSEKGIFSCLQKKKIKQYPRVKREKSLPLFIPVITIMTLLHFYFLCLYCPGQRENFIPFYTCRIKLYMLF